jgi:hypothetical protein
MPVHENSLAASEPFNYAAIDGEVEKPPPVSLPDIFEFGRRIVSYIRSKDRARLTTDCLFLALGDAELEQETMTSVAKRHGITKAAVSKRTKEVRVHLHLNINANNKSTHAVEKYRANRSPLRLQGPA